MSIRPRLGVEVPELTARVARASNPAGTTAMWVRDRLDGLWADEDFASWYPRDGRPGISPAQLATVSVLQFLLDLSDRDAAEAVLEHKETLGSYQHGIFYVQEYVNKPQRDIRALVVGDRTIGAIYRSSKHWITNTARNGKASQMAVTPEIEQLCLRAAAAVGGGFLSVDLLEHPDGLLVNELNYTPEFHGFMDATGIPVADHVIDYVEEIAEKPAVA